MPKDSDDDFEQRAPPRPFVIFTIIQVVISDIVLYGLLIPLLGTFLAGTLADQFELQARWELVAAVFFTFFLIYGTFSLLGETTYWKHLFAFDKFYCVLLQVRDGVNAILFVIVLAALATSVEAMVNEDRAMKTPPVSEGVIYVFLKALINFFNLDESLLLHLGFKPPHDGGILDPSFGENEKFEHGAVYMLYWAMLTGCIAKLVYFNTLFTYLRAMEIFISMKPTFNDDDDYDSSTSFFSIRQSRQSRMETDFANSVRKSRHSNNSAN